MPIQLQKIANQDDGGNTELALKLSTPDRQIESLMAQCKPTRSGAALWGIAWKTRWALISRIAMRHSHPGWKNKRRLLKQRPDRVREYIEEHL